MGEFIEKILTITWGLLAVPIIIYRKRLVRAMWRDRLKGAKDKIVEQSEQLDRVGYLKYIYGVTEIVVVVLGLLMIIDLLNLLKEMIAKK